MFHVQYFSTFANEWKDYIAPTFNARTFTHERREDAEARKTHLEAQHPRDSFRVWPNA